MKQKSKTNTDSIIFYVLLLILVVASLSILKQKKTISLLKKYEIQFNEAENWNSSNFVLRNLWIGKDIDYSTLSDANSGGIQMNSSIYLIFAEEYCESCMKAEITRIKKHSKTKKIGVLALPRNGRQIQILAQSSLIDITPLGKINQELGFLSSKLNGLLAYLKIENGRVVDLIIADEAFSNHIDKWLEINNTR